MLEENRAVIKLTDPTLAGVAQWIDLWPETQMAASSIPSQGTCLGCEPGPQLGGDGQATTH